jgi:hypothetical protein
MRLLVTAPLAVLLVGAALPSAAAPISTARVAQVRFTLAPSATERFEIDLSATSDSRLDLAVTRCFDGDCLQPTYYAGAVPLGSVTVDGATATGKVHATIAGVDVVASWRPQAPGTVIISGAHGGGTGDDSTFTAYRVDPADVVLSIDGVGCHGTGGVGDEAFVQVPEGAAGDQVPLSRLRLPSVAPVCMG